MSENNIILSRFFTQNVLFDMMNNRNNGVYETVVKKFVENPQNKDNATLISEIYRSMSKVYRNEYFYQNTLLNKLLIGKHSLKTTTALTQVPINKSKADFILINGKAVVYEIKSELDTFERLKTQIKDYYKAFSYVCVVTSENKYDAAKKLLERTPVGIYTLTKKNTISLNFRKEPKKENSYLDYTTMFKVLHKNEFENIIRSYYGELPKASQAFYYGECLKEFSKIPIVDLYDMFLVELKRRSRICEQDLKEIPYELRSLLYFSNPVKIDLKKLGEFLNNKHGG